MAFDPVAATNIQPLPLSYLTSYRCSVTVNGVPAEVHETEVAYFIIASFDGPADLAVTLDTPPERAVVRPLRHGITPAIDGATVSLQLPGPAPVSLEMDNGKPLFVFASPRETTRPSPGDPGVLYYGGGGVHEVERIELRDNQTLYVEEGTVVRTVVRAENARSITVTGRGIIDGVNSHRGTDTSRLMLFRNCEDVKISGVTLINPASWMIVLMQCDRVHIDGIREIGINVGSDGVDVVASSNVLIENTFQRNNDDCVVVKGFGYDKSVPGGNVENVLVRNCVLLNAHAGNVMEIGFETRCERIHNITFRDIDVIGAHGEGGVFTIHNAEQAEVSTVLYEDIRVENFYDRLIDFRIFHSRYSRQDRRGRIRDVTLRRIRTVADRYNTLSIMGGYDSDHLVERVTIEDFVMGDQHIKNEDQLHLFTRWARDVVFA